MNRVTMQEPSSALLIIDGRQRIAGTPNNFVVDLKGQIEGVNHVRLVRAIAPKLPTINSKNDTIALKVDNGGIIWGPVTQLNHGYYNQVSFINELQRAFIQLGNQSNVSFKIGYDPRDTSITIQCNGGHKFFFVDSCSFIRYGINVAHFASFPFSSTVSVVGSVDQHSSHVGMIYSRYMVVTSDALTQNEIASSRGGYFTNQNLIGCISLTKHYDYNTEGRFDGTFMTEDVELDTPLIRFYKTGREPLPSQIDLRIKDEFGFDIDEVLDITVLSAELNSNLASCCFIKVYF